MNGDDVVAVLVRVRGRVQGVNFRANTEDKAAELGLSGWVRNRVDGSVEAHAQGPRDRVEAFVRWCHHGEAPAQVTGVEQAPAPVDIAFSRFERRATA